MSRASSSPVSPLAETAEIFFPIHDYAHLRPLLDHESPEAPAITRIPEPQLSDSSPSLEISRNSSESTSSSELPNAEHGASHITERTPFSPVHSDNDYANSDSSWLPFTLRWYSLLLPTIISASLCVIIACISWYSKQHYGLGNDDGSSIILFGWRFVPTLIGVLYTQMTVILLEDLKITEPFTRLAKAPPGGASATGTVLYKPKAWWGVIFASVFRRKRDGPTSCALLCAVVVNVLALLIILPLTSAFLTSEQVVVPRSLDFVRMIPKPDSPIPMNATRETYFRTLASLTRDVSTSAWVSDSSFTFPFWPSSGKAQFGPIIDSNHGSWKAYTLVLHSGLDCKNMTLISADLSNKFYSAFDTVGKVHNGTMPMVTFLLASEDGCRYELGVHPGVDIARTGGVTWSSASTFLPLNLKYYFSGSAKNASNYTLTTNIQANVTPAHPYARLATSEQCADRDIIMLNTPWTNSTNYTNLLDGNQTFEKSPDFRMRAHICENQFWSTERSMATSMSNGVDSIIEDAPGSIQDGNNPKNIFNVSEFQRLVLQDNWKTYFDIDAAAGQLQAYYKYHTIIGYSGLGPGLGMLSNFDFSAMLSDPNLMDKAARVKGRFFSEVLRDTLGSADSLEQKPIGGEMSMVEDRVVVVTEVGIALAVLFFVSFCHLLLIFWSSRLSRRPLNLKNDPTSTVGASALIAFQQNRDSTLRRMQTTSKSDLYTALRRESFWTSQSTLQSEEASTLDISNEKSKKSLGWRPWVIHLRALLALGLFLLMILAAILVLHELSKRNRLYQKAFVYETSISKFGLTISGITPISIAPTIIGIIAGLWWDQVDSTFRTLQPYISMSRAPMPLDRGAELTYRSKTWIGAALKAGANRHWLLFSITFGSTLCQILTVSMSALFERKAEDMVKEKVLNRSLEARQIPIITQPGPSRGTIPGSNVNLALQNLPMEPTDNWIYSAVNQLSLNGSDLPWTQDEWSFIPIDLSQVPSVDSIQYLRNDSGASMTWPFMNVTMDTSAIRIRLECNAFEEVSNSSTWIHNLNYTGEEDLLADVPDWIAADPEQTYKLDTAMFSPTNFTTWITPTGDPQCCANETDKSNRSSVAIGSCVSGSRPGMLPQPFITKWIRGPGFMVHDSNLLKNNVLLFNEIPSLQAAECRPVVEAAEASVMVDKDTGTVQSYNIHGPPTVQTSVWEDYFVLHPRPNATQPVNSSHLTEADITTSYGIVFLTLMMEAQSRQDEANATLSNAYTFYDQANGLNMDYMSYCMYALAGKDPNALLDYTTLVTTANRTMQTFFQHFVASNLSLTDGGMAYQKIGDTSMDKLGPPVNNSGDPIPANQWPILNTNRTVIATVSYRIQVLHINTVATYISVAILTWLIITSFFVAVLQRQYTRLMRRNVESLADTLVLVAASDNFLALVRERGLSVKRDRDVVTKLGWFRGKDGKMRWGVEIVGGRDAVEWLDRVQEEGTPRNRNKKGTARG